MAWDQTIKLLSEPRENEQPQSKALREQALSRINEATEPVNSLPGTLLDLLIYIIKPLFSATKHKNLTSTGRQNLVGDALPSTVSRFGDLYEDNIILWKNGWSHLLLLEIIKQFHGIKHPTRKKSLEEAFYLLVPPILHQIDDSELQYKQCGLECLRILCDTLVVVESDILRKSGLMDVFLDAMKNGFTLLPSLMEEEDSIVMFQAIYPAWRTVVKARFQGLVDVKEQNSQSITELQLRVRYLHMLFRHSLLYGLNHLSVGGGLGTTSYPKLGRFFVSQISWIFTDLGIEAVAGLKDILPLLQNVLIDPFVMSCPALLFETCRALQQIACVCWPRIRDRWWVEILRGVVQCWLNIVDDLPDVKNEKQKQVLADVQQQLKILTALLEDIVGEEFVSGKRTLVASESLLEDLFDGDFKTEHTKHGKILVQEIVTE